MCDISSVTEKCQQIKQQVLQCTGAVNIVDDIIIHGVNKEEHDKMLVAVMKKIKECGMTLNRDKCKFNLSKINFCGLVLPDKGTAPTDEKVSAVMEAHEPNYAAEV